MPVDLQNLSRRLFAAANQLWTNTALRPDQYAQPVLALIALRQMEAKFDLVHAEVSETFTGRLSPTPPDDHGRGAVYLPDNARFSRQRSGFARKAAPSSRLRTRSRSGTRRAF